MVQFVEIPSPPPITGGDYEDRRLAQMGRAISDPPVPDAYKGLRTGPEMSIDLELAQASPISMANSLLRNLSPFMFQVEPPLVYGEDAAFTSSPKGSFNPDVYGRVASSGMSAYQAARAKVSQSGIVGISYEATEPQQYIVQNSVSPTSMKAADGSLTDADGGGSSRLGQPAIADLYTATDIATQLSAILNTPPLVLLINPSNLQITYTKIQQFQDRSRSGYIFHSWGEDQPKLSITAKCGAFMSSGRGVQFASKRDSAAWQNLMSAFQFYKNNGYIYDTVGKSNAHLFVGALSIHFDGWVYYGHMESFSWNFEESLQHGGIEFSMEFVVSSMLDTVQPTYAVAPMHSPTPSLSDPRYMGMAPRGGDNRPGVYSVDLFSSRPNISVQGRVVAGEGGAEQNLPGDRVTEKQTSTEGFQLAETEDDTEIAQVPVSGAQAYGV